MPTISWSCSCRQRKVKNKQDGQTQLFKCNESAPNFLFPLVYWTVSVHKLSSTSRKHISLKNTLLLVKSEFSFLVFHSRRWSFKENIKSYEIWDRITVAGSAPKMIK